MNKKLLSQKESEVTKEDKLNAEKADPNENLSGKQEENQKHKTPLFSPQTDYYELLIKRAEKNLEWALKLSRIGISFFIIPFILTIIITSVGVIFKNLSMSEITAEVITSAISNITVILVICGILIEIVALSIFYFYSKTMSQLEMNQRFLAANSICEDLTGEFKQQAQLRLIDYLTKYEFEYQEQIIEPTKNTGNKEP